jgi:hypothetical protein
MEPFPNVIFFIQTISQVLVERVTHWMLNPTLQTFVLLKLWQQQRSLHPRQNGMEKL